MGLEESSTASNPKTAYAPQRLHIVQQTGQNDFSMGTVRYWLQQTHAGHCRRSEAVVNAMLIGTAKCPNRISSQEWLVVVAPHHAHERLNCEISLLHFGQNIAFCCGFPKKVFASSSSSVYCSKSVLETGMSTKNALTAHTMVPMKAIQNKTNPPLPVPPLKKPLSMAARRIPIDIANPTTNRRRNFPKAFIASYLMH